MPAVSLRQSEKSNAKKTDLNSHVSSDAAAETRTDRRPGLLSGWFRDAVHRATSRVDDGRLTLVDGQGRFDAGRAKGTDLRATIRVCDPRTYRHIFLGGSLGAAEAYLRGFWSCDDLVAAFRILARNADVLTGLDQGWSRLLTPLRWLESCRRRNTRLGSRRNIAAHYDLNNDFFAQFLDPTMTYSCGIFESADATMEEASLAKYERACRKLNLSADDHLLEIGTGWGGLAIYAAQQFGCRVTTATVSREQYRYARERIRAEGLDDKITLLLRDYRDLEGQFDKLVSIEMIEAVGHEFLPTYFRRCARLLRPGGKFFLQSITMPDERYERYRKSVDFVRRYIFPGGCVPSMSAIARAVRRASGLQLVETEDFAAHYARTLELWRERFFENIGMIRALGFTERLIRAWHYYLCYCEAGFREQRIGLAHVLLEKPRG